MSARSIQGIENMLAQMRATAEAASALPVSDTPRAARARHGFAAELGRSLQKVSTMQTEAANQAQAYSLGKPGISLNDVMIDLQKANLAFQTSIQVRNRLVAAYQEIASMPV